MVELRFSFDPGHLLEVHRGLGLLFHHPFYHQTNLALCEVVAHHLLCDCLALVLDRPCHPCHDPILAPLCEFLYICPPFLWHDSRDWMSRCLLRSHVEMTYGEAIVIFFARLVLYLALSLARGLVGGRHGLLSNPV